MRRPIRSSNAFTEAIRSAPFGATKAPQIALLLLPFLLPFLLWGAADACAAGKTPDVASAPAPAPASARVRNSRRERPSVTGIPEASADTAVPLARPSDARCSRTAFGAPRSGARTGRG